MQCCQKLWNSPRVSLKVTWAQIISDVWITCKRGKCCRPFQSSFCRWRGRWMHTGRSEVTEERNDTRGTSRFRGPNRSSWKGDDSTLIEWSQNNKLIYSTFRVATFLHERKWKMQYQCSSEIPFLHSGKVGPGWFNFFRGNCDDVIDKKVLPNKLFNVSKVTIEILSHKSIPIQLLLILFET